MADTTLHKLVSTKKAKFFLDSEDDDEDDCENLNERIEACLLHQIPNLMKTVGPPAINPQLSMEPSDIPKPTSPYRSNPNSAPSPWVPGYFGAFEDASGGGRSHIVITEDDDLNALNRLESLNQMGFDLQLPLNSPTTSAIIAPKQINNANTPTHEEASQETILKAVNPEYSGSGTTQSRSAESNETAVTAVGLENHGSKSTPSSSPEVTEAVFKSIEADNPVLDTCAPGSPGLIEIRGATSVEAVDHGKGSSESRALEPVSNPESSAVTLPVNPISLPEQSEVGNHPPQPVQFAIHVTHTEPEPPLHPVGSPVHKKSGKYRLQNVHPAPDRRGQEGVQAAAERLEREHNSTSGGFNKRKEKRSNRNNSERSNRSVNRKSSERSTPSASYEPIEIIRGGFEGLPKDELPHDFNPLEIVFPPVGGGQRVSAVHARDPNYISKTWKFHMPDTNGLSTSPVQAPVESYCTQQKKKTLKLRSLGGQILEGDVNPNIWNGAALGLLGLTMVDGTFDDKYDVKSQSYDEEPVVQCWRCSKIHIKSGLPETLPDRDSCGHYLPGWFPAHLYTKDPWVVFKDLWTHMLYAVEITLLSDNSLEPVARPLPHQEPRSHPADRKWKDVNNRAGGGTWRCRNGPNATLVELECERCQILDFIPSAQNSYSTTEEIRDSNDFLVRKRALDRWVYRYLKQLGVDDCYVAEQIVQNLGKDRVAAYPFHPEFGEMAREWRWLPWPAHLRPVRTPPRGRHKGEGLKVLIRMERPKILHRYPLGAIFPRGTAFPPFPNENIPNRKQPAGLQRRSLSADRLNRNKSQESTPTKLRQSTNITNSEEQGQLGVDGSAATPTQDLSKKQKGKENMTRDCESNGATANSNGNGDGDATTEVGLKRAKSVSFASFPTVLGPKSKSHVYHKPEPCVAESSAMGAARGSRRVTVEDAEDGDEAGNRGGNGVVRGSFGELGGLDLDLRSRTARMGRISDID